MGTSNWVYISMMVYAAESFPTVVRAAAIGIALASGRIGAGLALPFAGVLLQSFGDKVYFLFASIYTFGGVFSLVLLPDDTKGKLLNDHVQAANMNRAAPE